MALLAGGATIQGQQQDIRRGGSGGGGGGPTNGITIQGGAGNNNTFTNPTLRGVITAPLLTPDRAAMIGTGNALTNHPTMTTTLIDRLTNLTSDAQAQINARQGASQTLTNLAGTGAQTNRFGSGVSGITFATNNGVITASNSMTLWTNVFYVNADRASATANGTHLTNMMMTVPTNSMLVVGPGDYYSPNLSYPNGLARGGVIVNWQFGARWMVTGDTMLVEDDAGALNTRWIGYGQFSLTNNGSTSLLYLDKPGSRFHWEFWSLEGVGSPQTSIFQPNVGTHVTFHGHSHMYSSHYDIAYGDGAGQTFSGYCREVRSGGDLVEFVQFDKPGDSLVVFDFIETGTNTTTIARPGGNQRIVFKEWNNPHAAELKMDIAATNHAIIEGGTIVTPPGAVNQYFGTAGALIGNNAADFSPTAKTALWLKNVVLDYSGIAKDPIMVTNDTFALTLENCTIKLNSGATNWARAYTAPSTVRVLGGLALLPWKPSSGIALDGVKALENFGTPSAGQVVGFHDEWTKTNLTVSGGAANLQTNANQFGASTTLTLKDGVRGTNINSFGQLSVGPVDDGGAGISLQRGNYLSASDGSIITIGDGSGLEATPILVFTNAYITDDSDSGEAARYRFNHPSTNRVMRAFEIRELLVAGSNITFSTNSLGVVTINGAAGGGGGGGPGTLPMNANQFDTNNPVSAKSGFLGTNFILRGLTMPSLTASRPLVLNGSGDATNAAGTPDGTKFLRDDGTLAVPPGVAAGGSAAIQFNEGGALAGTNRFLFDRSNHLASIIGDGSFPGALTVTNSAGTGSKLTPFGVGSVSDTLFSLFVGNTARWSVLQGAAANAYSFRPGTSNSQDIGDLLLTVRTNYANRFEAKEGLRIGLSTAGVGLELTNAVATTNIFRFSITNPVAGQLVKIHNVENFSGGTVVSVLTNAADETGASGSTNTVALASAFHFNTNAFSVGTTNLTTNATVTADLMGPSVAEYGISGNSTINLTNVVAFTNHPGGRTFELRVRHFGVAGTLTVTPIGPHAIDWGDSGQPFIAQNRTNSIYIRWDGGRLFGYSSHAEETGGGAYARSNAPSLSGVTLSGATIFSPASGSATVVKAAAGSVLVTNVTGLVEKSSAATIELDFNAAQEFSITNGISAATTVVTTNGATGQKMSFLMLGEAAGGTSRTVTIQPQLGHLVANGNDFGSALATSYSETLTNGNYLEASMVIRRMNGTNTMYVMTRQGKR